MDLQIRQNFGKFVRVMESGEKLNKKSLSKGGRARCLKAFFILGLQKKLHMV